MLKESINFIMELSVGIGVFILIVAGLLYATSAGNSGNIEKAKEAVTSVIIGLIIISIAWLIIAVILQGMGYSSATTWSQVNCNVSTAASSCVCGDGIVDSELKEICDGVNLGGKSCVDFGFGGGVLKCVAGCKSFDISSCSLFYKITGNVKDAMTLFPISGALMEVLDSDGGVVVSATTNASGNYELLSVPGGQVIMVRVTKTGYAVGSSGDLTLNADAVKDFALSGSGAGFARVVLSWGANPSDLDTHLVFGTTHIYYSNKGPDNGSQLDVDDTSGYGPETLTINALVAGATYTYYVYDYNANNTTAGAKVEVYNSGGAKIKEFNSPGAGTWNVFTVNGDTGVITAL